MAGALKWGSLISTLSGGADCGGNTSDNYRHVRREQPRRRCANDTKARRYRGGVIRNQRLDKKDMQIKPPDLPVIEISVNYWGRLPLKVCFEDDIFSFAFYQRGQRGPFIRRINITGYWYIQSSSKRIWLIVKSDLCVRFFFLYLSFFAAFSAQCHRVNQNVCLLILSQSVTCFPNPHAGCIHPRHFHLTQNVLWWKS